MTELSRRAFLDTATCALITLGASRSVAAAELYPTRPVRLTVGFPPGGAADVAARLIGQWLSDRMHQPIVVENRSGASGNVGTEAVVHAAPDGYQLLLATGTNTINAALYDKLAFNFIDDIAPVAAVSRNPFVVEVSRNFPPRLCASSWPMRAPILARSPWHRPAMGRPTICSVSCSRS